MPEQMLKFKLVKELRGLNRTIVEVWKDDVFVAGVYPHETTVVVVSKYLKSVKADKAYPPKAIMEFAVKGC